MLNSNYAADSIGLPILNHTVALYKQYRASYRFYEDMFKLLFKFDDFRHKNLSDLDLSNSAILELMDFGWILAMYLIRKY